MKTVLSALFPWKRLWLSGRVHFQPNSDGYFPNLDPRPFIGPVPDLTHLELLGHVRCLVLLGDPGMGKSTELRATYERLRELHGDSAVFLIDVQHHGSVKDALGRCSGRMHQRLETESTRTFALLDGLDVEASGIVRGVRRIQEFLETISPVHRQRLSLWITCRSTDWQGSSEDALRSLFGPSEFGNSIPFATYRLAPLTRADIKVAAQVRGMDGERFVVDVSRVQAQGLAERPITLRFLLDRVASGTTLSSDPITLYRDGLAGLCAEFDHQRAESGLSNVPPAGELYECAEHLAAVLQLTGGSAWIHDHLYANCPVTASTVDELRREVSFRVGPARDIEAVLIRATLRSALFTRQGDQVDFAHRAYAEFLAADCLRTRGLEIDEALRLLRDPNDPRGRVAAQLRGVAAWWAAMVPEARARLEDTELQILLRSGARFYPDDVSRERLVTRLLDGLECGLLTEDPYEISLYTDLRHPKIEEQLASYLQKPEAPEAVWRAARSIASACGTCLPFSELARIACDPRVPANRRAFAATLVADGDNVDAKVALRSVLEEADAPDGVFGTTLRALWPMLMDVEDLLRVLRPPRNEYMFDRYHDFLDKHLFQCLHLEDLPALLRGLEERPDLNGSRAIAHVIYELLRIGWCNFHQPALAEAFARALLTRLLLVIEMDVLLPLDTLLGDDFLLDFSDGWPGTGQKHQRYTGDRRRELVRLLIADAATRSPPLADHIRAKLIDILVLAEPPLMRAEDRTWLATRESAAPAAEQTLWREIGQQLDAVDGLLASTGVIRHKYPAARFLGGLHLQAVDAQQEPLESGPLGRRCGFAAPGALPPCPRAFLAGRPPPIPGWRGN